jgi:hypothetical protein
MTCVRIEHGFICLSPLHKLRLSDGSRVFMVWHNYLGPTFYRDRDECREIEDWFNSPLICNALDWFCQRGHRS